MKHHPHRRDFVRLGATAGAALALTGVTESAEGQTVGAAQGDALAFFDVVKSRRSVRKFKDTPIPDAVTKKVLGIPDRYTRVCITPIGVPEEWPESPPKKELEEFLVIESF